MCGKGSSAWCICCKICGAIVLLLVTLATVAALIGVWKTHMVNGGWSFGTPDASLALLVFILGITIWKKMFHKMCGCGWKGCGCGCGCGKCECGGKCAACGHDPCTCK